MEGPVGLEPTTPCLKGRCSNQLSYGPVQLFEHITTEVTCQCFAFFELCPPEAWIASRSRTASTTPIVITYA